MAALRAAVGLRLRGIRHTGSSTTLWINNYCQSQHTLASPPNYRRLILESRVYDAAKETPLQYARTLSHQLQNRIYFKREDLQPVFSFKIRGAYNKMAHLSPAEKQAGVVCCSAGNHAQGVALSARMLGIHATIVMPLATPEIKLTSVQQHGGEWVSIVLHGKSFDEAAAESKRIEKEQQRTMILPFDDPYVIAGQGTIGKELLQQTTGEQLDAVFVCCGGGGMLAGIAAWVKQIRPNVKVIGVEAADAAGMTTSLQAHKRVELAHVGLFADGAAVKLVGAETYRVCAEYVDEMITVSTDEICAAIKHGFNDTRVVLEPAGALAIAGLVQYTQRHGIVGSTMAAITSGANIDFTRLRFVSERADSHEHLVSVQIPEKPGAFRTLCDQIDQAHVTITEFSYRYAPSTQALIHLSFQATSNDATSQTMKVLTNEYENVLDLTWNELAKVHTRHLAGGKAKVPKGMKEFVYRFEFSHRPGAFKSFINQFSDEWNISLFHYRNHGADLGRVLVGFHVSNQDYSRFQAFLDQLGYTYHEETNNPLYQEWII